MILLLILLFLLGSVLAMELLPNIIEGSAQIQSFPWKRDFMNKSNIINRFKNLQRYKPNFIKRNYNVYNISNMKNQDLWYLNPPAPKLLAYQAHDHHKNNEISDYFIEDVRALARRYDQDLNMIDWYKSNKELVLTSAISQFGNATPYNLRETIWKLYGEVGTFRPTNLAAMIELYKPKSILDFSAGWGDRLIAAMAKNIPRYVGVDPNSPLHAKYKEMVKFFNSKIKATFIDAPFEDADLKDEKFDMVFTSPPYFDLEIYSDAKTQSHHLGKSWFDSFLIPALNKACDHLNVGGHMIIVINDIRDGPSYVKNMIDEVNKRLDVKYLGLIGYAEVNKGKIRSPQPMWIWQKIEPIVISPPLEIIKARAGDRTYNVFQECQMPGGSKQRMYNAFANVKEPEIVYAGPNIGLAQVALGIIAKYWGKKATLFTNGIRDGVSNLTARAMTYGVRVNLHNEALKDLQIRAERYAKENGAYICPFGFDSPELQESFIKEITRWKLPKPEKIWLVSGSGTLINMLYQIFPDANYGAVQVGKTIWPDQINDKTQLYVHPLKFSMTANVLPPYPSVPEYDAKAWEFILKHGKDGDYIWNVGC